MENTLEQDIENIKQAITRLENELAHLELQKLIIERRELES